MTKNESVDSASMHPIVHTPGPWGVEQTSCTNWIGPMRSGENKINRLVAQNERDGLHNAALARNDANARLIAAAPELAEALRELHDFAEVSTLNRHHARSIAAFFSAAELLKRIGC